MKRILLIVTAAVAAATIGMASASAVTPAAAPTNAAAVAHLKKIFRFISNHQVVRMYKALAPKQHNLLSEKKFVKCFGPSVNHTQYRRITKVLAVHSFTRTTIPGYRGVRVLDKRVGYNDVYKMNGKVHRDTHVYRDVVYVNGAMHWILSHSEIQLCRSI